MVIVEFVSCARTMGAEMRRMLVNASMDVRTNFFIQSSWELPKWRSIFKHSLTERATVIFKQLHGGQWVLRYHSLPYGVGRIIESPATCDKRTSV
jgi:hypothetical protein